MPESSSSTMLVDQSVPHVKVFVAKAIAMLLCGEDKRAV